MKANEFTSKRFGMLAVVKPNGSDEHGNRIWQCVCDCGNELMVAGYNLRTGHTQSCGCLKRSLAQQKNKTHGNAGGMRTTEYRSWRSAKGRCFNQNKEQYKDYGGRGITMCDRWADSFESFLEDMGPKPSLNYSVDRIDNNGHYSCGKCQQCQRNQWAMNCRWATRTEQARNRRARRNERTTA